MEKAIDKKRSIGQAAEELGVRTHVIRFWESKFPQIKPEIGKGDRRYYFDTQMEILNKIKSLLHEEGYTISGLQKALKQRKKSADKEENIEFLLSEKEFGIDDFLVKDDAANVAQKDQINQILARIEGNLKKLSS
jgi:DNA-binding transcriptional MerR regulator